MKHLLFLVIFAFGLSLSALATDIKPSPLSKDTRAYIAKVSSKSSKKLVLYTPGLAESTCPHVQYYFNFLKKIMQKPKVQELYTLKKQPDPPKQGTAKNIEKWNTFADDCQVLCVVSLENNWIYRIGGGYKEPDVGPLMDILDALAYQ